MKHTDTTLIQLTETSHYMMGFVIVTKNDTLIVIDGGRIEDMPLLKETIAGRHISAWILTHPHLDHVSGFLDELTRNNLADLDVEKVYYNFPPLSMKENHNVPDYDYLCVEVDEILPAFTAVEPQLGKRAHIVQQGESIQIDEIRIDFLYTWHEGLYANPINDASLAFKLHGPKKTVMFLGDLGPDAGDILYRESRHLLKADIVQMAHHGHMNVGMEVYAAIMPEICLWCCPEWLYNEAELPSYLADTEKFLKKGRLRMYGTRMTRMWMDILGVKTPYVTKDGTHTLTI